VDGISQRFQRRHSGLEYLGVLRGCSFSFVVFGIRFHSVFIFEYLH
jgi:hypothetical protein